VLERAARMGILFIPGCATNSLDGRARSATDGTTATPTRSQSTTAYCMCRTSRRLFGGGFAFKRQLVQVEAHRIKRSCETTNILIE
jgi:hypothetical protein